MDIILTLGTNEDKDWTVNINGFDLTNVTLKSQIRSEETRTLVGSFTAVPQSANTVKLSMSKVVSALIPPGEYVSDILATSTIDGKNTFITPIMKVVVIGRVTEPT